MERAPSPPALITSITLIRRHIPARRRAPRAASAATAVAGVMNVIKARGQVDSEGSSGGWGWGGGNCCS